MRATRLLSLASAALLVPALALSGPAGADPVEKATSDQVAEAPTLNQATKSRYHAKLRITKHGIPHVTAKNWGSLGYGSGYAAADASICNLADTLLSARGKRSRYLGADTPYNDIVSMEATNLQVDALVTDMHNRRVVEKLLKSKAGPTHRARKLVRGYVAGINRWIRDNKITDPACKKAAWIKPNATTLDLWYGIYLANVLASTGHFVKEIVDAAPPTLEDPGLPDLGGIVGVPLPTSKKEVPAYAEKLDADELRASLRTDEHFGSNATAIGGDETTTGRGMLLGNPHFPWVGRYRFTQQHLTIPGKYDAAGGSLIGSPAVNIGWNKDVAWSHTVSTAYRFTPYEFTTPVPGTSYLSTDGLIKQAEKRIVKIKVKQDDGSIGTVTEDLYRVPLGYVIDSPSQLMGWMPTSFWAIRDANGEQLRTIDSFLSMGQAKSARDLLRRQDAGGGIPWVNTIAADRKGTALYADHSVVPNVPDTLADRCMTVIGRVLDLVAGLPGLNGSLGDACAWGTDDDAQRPGIFGPKNLPETFRRDWVFNANDSYWAPNDKVRLEGFAGIIGCERCARTMRSRMVSQYVRDRLAKKGKESPKSLRSHEYANRVRAAEVMREDGKLDEVCAATGETEACAVLKAWDGRSDTDSVGTHIFEAFVTRAPTGNGLWSVPFDANDPYNTPRGLKTAAPVVDAMQSAIDAIRDAGVPFDAKWGSLQVAADRGAPLLPISGGEGDLSGNANAVASREPASHVKAYKPVSYGSSHIQAIAFLDHGKVDARTILTYGQYENPLSRWSSDQTRLFSKEKWVTFPFTEKQIKKQLVRTVNLRGR